MKRILAVTVFMLAMLGWAVAQQPSGMPERGGGQSTSPSQQMPGQSPGSTGQDVPNAGAPNAGAPNAGAPASPAAAAPITEGCLAGSSPNFTITDKAGTTYKLNIPANSDASPLNAHVGESVQVLGQVNNTGKESSIDVSKIGRGTGKCANSSGAQPPQK